MPTDANPPSGSVNPRPELVKAMGILNVVFAVMILIGLVMESFWLFAVIQRAPAFSEPGAPPSANPSGLAMFGMNDPRFIQFTFLDAITGLVLNLMMLASGIGLINLHRWGGRLWFWTAWLKIARLVVLWGGLYIVVVSPPLSLNMARSLLSTMNAGQGMRGAPSLGQLTRVYATMNLIAGVGMIVFGTIYPALSLWMLGRPGVKAALGIEARKEPELT